MMDPRRLDAARRAARDRLLAWRTPEGHWVGRLASSPLATATAVSALSLAGDEAGDRERIGRGIAWLADRQNEDGGWGDTDRSRSNIATTALAAAAFRLAGAAAPYAAAVARAERYLARQGGWEGVRRRYGPDRTFAAPILANAALAGMADWSETPCLPFELACLPQRLYRFLRLPVVSYAIPALVAIGQARARRGPCALWRRPLQALAAEPSLRVLERMQPASGGYLEATPLTSFVVMSLASIGRGGHPVVRRGLAFLRASMRSEGAWPIDTNLATWVTTLAVNGLAAAGEDVGRLTCWDWLLACQHVRRHPYTGAPPGGWGWTDLSGAVPDADDTAGALLALAAWRDSPGLGPADRARAARRAAWGVRWLLGLQNRDGGWPTFCRGWGRLPFDRSSPDLTAHALRALAAWGANGKRGSGRLAGAAARGFRYLERAQQPDGSWNALWFGNEDHPREENPVYGTARVLLAYAAAGGAGRPPARRGAAWLAEVQGADGGWSGAGREGAGTMEETALAVEALLAVGRDARARRAAEAGLAWLADRLLDGEPPPAAPIGFYFAKLWYYEELYPLTFAVSALGRAVRGSSPPDLQPAGRVGSTA